MQNSQKHPVDCAHTHTHGVFNDILWLYFHKTFPINKNRIHFGQYQKSIGIFNWAHLLVFKETSRYKYQVDWIKNELGKGKFSLWNMIIQRIFYWSWWMMIKSVPEMYSDDSKANHYNCYYQFVYSIKCTRSMFAWMNYKFFIHFKVLILCYNEIYRSEAYKQTN